MGKLLALVDGSEYSGSVCDHAVWFAERTGFSVDLMHVLGRRGGGTAQANLSGSIGLGEKSALLEELIELDASSSKVLQKRGWAILEEAVRRLEAAGVSEVRSHLRFGDIVESVGVGETDADVVMIGKRGEAADFASQHLGSNLERIVRACHHPVLVASRAWQPIQRVLVAFDGGESCNKAVDYIASSPVFDDLDIQLLSVGNQSVAGQLSLDGAVARLRNAGRSAEGDIRPGQPEQVIAEAVDRDGANMLIMGAYGHSRIRTLIIGSTTTTMMRLCKVPVMLFR